MMNEKTRILIVEDENDIGRIIQLAMQTLDMPFELDLALSAEEGLGLWQREPYDLVMTDYNLRGMTGMDLIRYIRQQGHTIPMVLFTAYDSPQVRRDASEQGVSAYIPKPFFIDDLVQQVRGLLPKHPNQPGNRHAR